MTTSTPGWYPDPMHRHEVRYFDGSAWTDHVADAGTQQIDPITATTTSTTAPAPDASHGHDLPPPQPVHREPVPTSPPPTLAAPSPSTAVTPAAPTGGTGRAGSSGSSWKLIVGIVAVTALIVGLVIVVGGDDEGGDDGGVVHAAELFLEPAIAVGTDPFTPSIDTNTAPPPIRIEPSTTAVETDPTTTSAAPTASMPASVGTTTAPLPPTTVDTGADAVGTRSVPATAPGLYGGTRDNRSCDQAKMIEFLSGQPGKAAAWAGVHGIATDQIAAYIMSLTPVVLRADTRVTNHGFRDGVATSNQAVLQMGTAVLVDDYGIPRARCSCGNPLTPPAPLPEGYVERGTPWPGYDPTTVIVVVNVTNIVIDEFVLVDLNGGYFGRVPATKSPTGTITDGTIYVDAFCDLFPTAPECLPPVETVPPTAPTTVPATTSPEPVLGTGDIQFTLRWSSTADLDLAVLDPNGEEINFDQPMSSSGGQLDVDSNAICDSAVTNPVENIFWPAGASPMGTYQVSVRYFGECGGGAGPQPFTLTVVVDGVEVAVQPVTTGLVRQTDTVNAPGDARQYSVDKSAPVPITTPTIPATTTPATTAPTTAVPTSPPTTAGPTPITAPQPITPPTTVAPGETMTLEDYCQQLYGPGAVVGPANPMFTLCMHDPTVD